MGYVTVDAARYVVYALLGIQALLLPVYLAQGVMNLDVLYDYFANPGAPDGETPVSGRYTWEWWAFLVSIVTVGALPIIGLLVAGRYINRGESFVWLAIHATLLVVQLSVFLLLTTVRVGGGCNTAASWRSPCNDPIKYCCIFYAQAPQRCPNSSPCTELVPVPTSAADLRVNPIWNFLYWCHFASFVSNLVIICGIIYYREFTSYQHQKRQ